MKYVNLKPRTDGSPELVVRPARTSTATHVLVDVDELAFYERALLKEGERYHYWRHHDTEGDAIAAARRAAATPTQPERADDDDRRERARLKEQAMRWARNAQTIAREDRLDIAFHQLDREAQHAIDEAIGRNVDDRRNLVEAVLLLCPLVGCDRSTLVHNLAQSMGEWK